MVDGACPLHCVQHAVVLCTSPPYRLMWMHSSPMGKLVSIFRCEPFERMFVDVGVVGDCAASAGGELATLFITSRMRLLKMYERIALAPSDAGTVCSARADAQRCWRCGKGEDDAMRLTLQVLTS